jgi:predicted nucleic acid-binding protein
MILVDTDILSALIKIDQLDALYAVFLVDRLQIVTAVLEELSADSLDRRVLIPPILDAIDRQRLEIVSLTDSERAFSDKLSKTLGQGERLTIAAAYARQAIVVSNESRVRHWCRQLSVECVNLPAILRGLWTSGIRSSDEVSAMIGDLQIHDRMKFSPTTLDTIFAPK